MKSFLSHLMESVGGNWVKPDDATIRREYEIEYRKHLVHELKTDAFPTAESCVAAVKKAAVVEVDPAMDSRILYRSRTRSMERLLWLIKGYRSYPKFRNEDTLNAIKDALLTGKPMDMPMVVKDEQGKMRVFAGNTRMDIAFMHGINPKVLMVRMPDGIRLS
jgi:hypothetical protein